jgi:hypothetical protein
MKAVLGTFVVLFSIFAHADLQQDYLELKDHGRSLQDTGTICEEVAVLEMQRQYGPQYTVLSGIEYGDQNRTIGELDLIVFDKNTNQAVLIGEVKCWKSMGGGLRKAHEQRQRFLQSLSSNKPLKFRLKDDPSIPFTKDQFTDAEEFISIAQKGSISSGYDMELEHSLNELMTLRDMIMKCQKSGSCKQSPH